MSQTEVSQSKIAVNLADNIEKRSLLLFWPFSLRIFFSLKQYRGQRSNATVQNCNWSAGVLDMLSW